MIAVTLAAVNILRSDVVVDGQVPAKTGGSATTDGCEFLFGFLGGRKPSIRPSVRLSVCLSVSARARARGRASARVRACARERLNPKRKLAPVCRGRRRRRRRSDHFMKRRETNASRPQVEATTGGQSLGHAIRIRRRNPA